MVTKIALNCRVSTSNKDRATENQLWELTAYYDRMGCQVVKIYED
jgi:DNA invertase Pin-like site-specific DNA recombinase